MSRYKNSVLELIISFLLARWLWKRYSDREREERDLYADELKDLQHKLEETNEHWDSL